MVALIWDVAGAGKAQYVGSLRGAEVEENASPAY